MTPVAYIILSEIIFTYGTMWFWKAKHAKIARHPQLRKFKHSNI